MSHPLFIKPGHKVNLKKYDTASTAGMPERAKADEQTERATTRIGELQDVLYAEGRRSLLVVLQGLDAAGKDGTVRRVFDHVNPTGISVTSFKTPTELELRHDFLWRCHQVVPPRGCISVFNRSYYEDVLIVRVHAEKLLRPDLLGIKDLWQKRYDLINNFEMLLRMNGTAVIKCFLHISKEEQRRRFEDRQKDLKRNWKLAAGDFAERQFWDDYQGAYEKMLTGTSTDHAPWYVIPSDRKWVRNYHIARIVEKTLDDMKLQWPKLTDQTLVKKKFK